MLVGQIPFMFTNLISTATLYPIMFSQNEDDNNSGSGHPPKKKPTRLAIGECEGKHLQ